MERKSSLKHLKHIAMILSVLLLMISAFSMASAESETSCEASDFPGSLEGYDESIAANQLSREGAIEAYPFYDVNGDPYDLSNRRWRVLFEDGSYERFIVTETGELSLIDKAVPQEPENQKASPYLIDFDKVKSEFDALGEVSNVRVVFDFSIYANLVFGTVNGKEYIVPFFVRPEWFESYENGKAYPAENIVSLINTTVKSGLEAAKKAGTPLYGGGGVSDRGFFSTQTGKVTLFVVIVAAAIILVVTGVITFNKMHHSKNKSF